MRWLSGAWACRWYLLFRRVQVKSGAFTGHSRPHLPRRPTRESIKGMSHRNRSKWDTRTSWPSQEDNTVQTVRPSISDTSWYFFNFSPPPRRGNMSHDVISVQYILLIPSPARLSSAAFSWGSKAGIMNRGASGRCVLAATQRFHNEKAFVFWALRWIQLF